LLQEFQTQAL